ncbi:conserved hypothetical protein [Candidatus Glomeribacter gigasporarum BEG34]|uniref:Antirestriction protein n=2 Tax=Candidatus Glomeribacter gigasporarum TaxID=132144 RepID=G2JBC8_9BURK|nr:conserved hypothetical protein [Candidatus Glomeribacter gigasporarum BEG34]
MTEADENNAKARKAFFEEHGAALAEAVLEHTGGDLSEAERLMAECYQGAYNDEVDYAVEVFDEQTAMPDGLRCYIDYERFAMHHIGCDCFTIEADGQVHIFRY